MKKEVRDLLKDEIKLVNQSRLKLVTGIVILLLNISLVVFSLFSISSLLFTIPLIIVIREVFFQYRLNSIMLAFTRCIIDDEYMEEIIK